jgi:Ca2+/Na+ antiporter
MMISFYFMLFLFVIVLTFCFLSEIRRWYLISLGIVFILILGLSFAGHLQPETIAQQRIFVPTESYYASNYAKELTHTNSFLFTFMKIIGVIACANLIALVIFNYTRRAAATEQTSPSPPPEKVPEINKRTRRLIR